MNVFLIFISVFFGSSGMILLSEFMRGHTNNILFLIIGVLLYGISVLTSYYLLSKIEVSILQPSLALTYPTTYILAILFCGERLNVMKISGLLLIILGIYLVTRSKK